jgi:hypothetical protein
MLQRKEIHEVTIKSIVRESLANEYIVSIVGAS